MLLEVPSNGLLWPVKAPVYQVLPSLFFVSALMHSNIQGDVANLFTYVIYNTPSLANLKPDADALHGEPAARHSIRAQVAAEIRRPRPRTHAPSTTARSVGQRDAVRADGDARPQEPPLQAPPQLPAGPLLRPHSSPCDGERTRGPVRCASDARGPHTQGHRRFLPPVRRPSSAALLRGSRRASLLRCPPSATRLR